MNQTNQKRTWRIIQLQIPREQEEMSGWLMMQLGANGCEVDPVDAEFVSLRATFEEDKLPGGETGRIVAALEEYGLSLSIASMKVSELMEEDWLAKWKEGFLPFLVGEHLMVCPAWLRDDLTAAEIGARKVILIEPGLAFGTGFHATTQFCLSALQEFVPSADRVIDVGTGSGILCVAASLLNSRCEIVALETDPLACRVAGENFNLNGVIDRVRLIEGSTEKILETDGADSKFDLLLSNLTYEDNCALLADYKKLTTESVRMIFAGVLTEKAALMREAFEKQGLRVEREELGVMWAGFVVRRA